MTLSELTEDLLNSIGGFNIVYKRKSQSPSKSWGKGKDKGPVTFRKMEIDGVIYKLNERDSEILAVVQKIIQEWLSQQEIPLRSDLPKTVRT